MKKKVLRVKKGFSLMEVLVSTFISILALSAIVNSLISSAYLVETCQEEDIATYHLKNIAERILATPFDSVTGRFPKGIVDGPSNNPYQNIVGGYLLTDEHITVDYPDPGADPLEIKIILSWQDKKGRTHTRSLSTYKSR